MLQKFLKYIRYEKNYSSHTVLSYKNDLSHFESYLKAEVGGVDYANVDTDIIRNYVVVLMEQGVSARSVGRKLSALRTLFRFLIKEKVVAASPAEMVTKPKDGKTLPDFVKEAEMDILLDEEIEESGTFEGVRDKLIISVLYQTGMRRDELITLRDKDVDFFANTLKVTGKRNKQRVIPFGNELREEIRRYLDYREKEVGSVTERLFVKKDGEPLYPVLVYRIVKRELCRVSTRKKLSPHVLRHTFASVMLNNGADLDSVKELLGHASLNSTQVYTHITFEELKHNYNQAHPRAIKKGGLYGD